MNESSPSVTGARLGLGRAPHLHNQDRSLLFGITNRITAVAPRITTAAKMLRAWIPLTAKPITDTAARTHRSFASKTWRRANECRRAPYLVVLMFRAFWWSTCPSSETDDHLMRVRT